MHVGEMKHEWSVIIVAAVVVAAVGVAVFIITAVVSGVGVIALVEKLSFADTGDSGSLSCCCDIVLGYSKVCLVVVVDPDSFV